jgi:hypothetical protein
MQAGPNDAVAGNKVRNRAGGKRERIGVYPGTDVSVSAADKCP